MQQSIKSPFNIIVIVAALGYFVDIYDLILFGIVRVPSLEALGLTGDAITTEGIKLLNIQMMGMLLGGIIWGVWGDKKGRLSVLFLTIMMYSVANILNGMITNLTQYYVLRFFAGLGLAGELGVGITLVSEVMSKETRGIGTTIVSAVGIVGAVAGFLVADLFDWRVAYYVGGGLGLILLLLRVSVYESGLFHKTKQDNIRRGSFERLFMDKHRFSRYIKCILIGVPVWYVIGIVVFLAPEFAASDMLNITGTVNAGKAVMYHYAGASIGALLTGIVSQRLQSRKRALLFALASLASTLVILFVTKNVSNQIFYFMMFFVGIPNGYWSIFITTASEQFGTNMRATVTTTVPNFVRGTTVIMTSAFAALKSPQILGTMGAAMTIGIAVFIMAIYATLTIEESYKKDLDFYENI